MILRKFSKWLLYFSDLCEWITKAKDTDNSGALNKAEFAKFLSAIGVFLTT